MADLTLVFCVALGASLVLTAAIKVAARRCGIVDQPDGKRKLHARATPLWGGIAVYLALVLGIVVARFGSFGAGDQLDELALAVLAAAGTVCLAGCLDDAFQLNSRLKLLLQICSVLPIVTVGYYVDSIAAFGLEIQLGWLGIPLTVLWIVGCINAVNLLDGMDGLASVVGISTAIMMAVIAAYVDNAYVAIIAVALAGSLAGFLAHNLPPASIFLGDSGSMVIGLVVGILSVQSTLKTSATLSITVPLVVMTFPMFDTLLAIVRRKLRGQRFDVADRQHIHHRLLDRGLNPWLVLAIIGALCLATGAAAIAATITRSDALAWATVITLVLLVIRLRLFGHHELAMLTGGLAQVLLALATRLHHSRPRNLPTSTQLDPLRPAEAWSALIQRVRPWKARQLKLVLTSDRGSGWTHFWLDSGVESSPNYCWSLAVTVTSPSGATCKLSAAGFDPADASLSPAGLTAVLNVFATYFANHPEKASELVEPAALIPISRRAVDLADSAEIHDRKAA